MPAEARKHSLLRPSYSMPSIDKIVGHDTSKSNEDLPRRSNSGNEKSTYPHLHALKSSMSESRLASAQLYRKRLSHAVIEIPAHHFRRIKNSENLGSYRRETKHFSETTTMHGPKRIYQGKRRSFVFWLCMVLCSLTFLSIQVYTLCTDYWKYPTVSQVSFQMREQGMDFPTVTICNFNPIKRSYIEKLNATGEFGDILLEYILESNVEPPALYSSANKHEFEKGQAALDEYKKEYMRHNNRNFSFNEFYNASGFECKDIFKMCSFGGRQFDCCSFAKATTLTNFGKCYSLDIYSSPHAWMQKQVHGGVQAGLQLIMDSHVEEQYIGPPNAKMMPPSFETGYRYYIHDRLTLAYMNSEGISVSPGMRVYSALATTSYVLLDHDNWGNCTSSWPAGIKPSLKFPYTAATCEYSFRASYFNATCGCSPTNYDVDDIYDVCTPTQTVKCMEKMDKMNEKKLNETDNDPHAMIPKSHVCKMECYSMVYEAFTSYGKMFSPSSMSWLGNQYPDMSADYIKENLLVINVFFRDMAHTEYTQVKSNSITTLLSNIGGNMGMFLGMSLITITEISLFLSKMGWIAISRRRRKYMADKKKKEELRHKEVEETVQEFKRIKSGRDQNKISPCGSDPRLDSVSTENSLRLPQIFFTGTDDPMYSMKNSPNGEDNAGFLRDKDGEHRINWC